MTVKETGTNDIYVYEKSWFAELIERLMDIFTKLLAKFGIKLG